MRVSVLQVNLASLKIAAHAIAPRSTLPVLGNILLKAERGGLELAAANGEFGVRLLVNAEVEAEGAIAVPARLLAEFVETLPPDRVVMELQTRTRTLHLRCGPYETNIRGIDAGEFPPLPAVTKPPTTTATVTATELRQAIKQVAFAAATDEIGSALSGVYTQLRGNHLRLVATDRVRMALRSIQLAGPCDLSIGVIMPVRALRELARIIGAMNLGEKDDVQVMLTEARNQIVFHLPGVDLVSQLIEARFPDYTKVIPATYATRAVVNTAAFLKAVRIARLFADDATHTIRVQVVPGETGKLIISANGTSGAITTEIEAVVTGQPLLIGFNGDFVSEALQTIHAPNVVFEAVSVSRPGVFRPEGDESGEHLNIIMPVDIAGR